MPPARIGALLVALAAACGCARFAKRAKSTEVARPAAFSQVDGDARQEPVERFVSAQEEDFVVRVVAGDVTCSGALIQDDQVLTAHHCVSKRSRNGDMMAKDVAADTIRVELGGDHFAWGEIGVKAVLSPSCGYAAGEGDIAILVLESSVVPGVPTRLPRLDDPPTMGEKIEPYGFGRCVYSNNLIHRSQRRGGQVDNVSHSRFQLMANICPGDSGGPAVNKKTGEIVGVISASVMDADEATLGRSEFTRLDAWRPLFAAAQMVSDGISLTELPPIECHSPGK